MEKWKDVTGFEGIYKVSSFGRVKSLDRIVIRKDGVRLKYKEKILKPKKDKKGYLRLSLNKNGLSFTKKVHRLVAIEFVENKFSKPQVNHIDEIKTNNNFENLEWVTNEENADHGTVKKRRYEISRVEVKQIDPNSNKIIKIHKSVTEASKELNMPRQAITRCCKGGRKTSRGFKWEYNI